MYILLWTVKRAAGHEEIQERKIGKNGRIRTDNQCEFPLYAQGAERKNYNGLFLRVTGYE